MYLVMYGEEEYKGFVLGVWDLEEGAIKCAKRKINSTKEENWNQKNKFLWSSGCKWVMINKINPNRDL